MSALAEHLKGRLVIASISGGKDSASLSLWLTEQGIEHRRVFMDTGWEHRATYEYLRGPLTAAIGPIEEISGAKQMEDLVLAKGTLPSRVRRFCTQELKAFPMVRFLGDLMDGGAEVVNAVGIRRGESAARSNVAEWEFSHDFDTWVWRPLADWSEQQVIDIHHRHGLRPNPLYLLGASRVGCWPCIFARKAEIELIADIDPERIERIRKLERAVAVAAEARYERDRAKWAVAPDPEPEAGSEKHERWEKKRDRLARPFQAPAWFQSSSEGDGFPMMPIDEAVAWSRTSHGGRQFDMFAPNPRDAGCLRWGMCDTNGEEP